MKLSIKTSIFKIHKRIEKKVMKRKEKPDDIRKKIKSRFFKTIKNKIKLKPPKLKNQININEKLR